MDERELQRLRADLEKEKRNVVYLEGLLSIVSQHTQAQEAIRRSAPPTPATMDVAFNVRPEVKAFALAMEAKLKENDHKRGWKQERKDWLYGRLQEEVEELGHLLGGLQSVGKFSSPEYRKKILREAADVANFAMMIADVCNTLEREETDNHEN
jgi:hypothetical protein